MIVRFHFESGGQSGARACGDERQAICRIHVEPTGDRRTHCAAHLHGRAFASQRETAAERQRAAEEFDRQDTLPPEVAIAVQHGFQMRDAAARGRRAVRGRWRRGRGR